MDDRDVARHWEGNAAAWTALSRKGYDVWRDLVNTPAFVAMMPSVKGLSGLDIGCGEGANTRTVARLGAKMTGVDISATFVELAAEEERREALGISYQVAPAQSLPFAGDSFDFATAFMSLMDMADYEGALREGRRVLRGGGFLQFSILHPCFNTEDRTVITDASGKVTAIQIGAYFKPAEFVEEWTFHAAADELSDWKPFQVPYFSRTLAQYLNAVVDAGFAIERVGEPTASEELVREHPRLQTLRVAPHLLHVLCRKRRSGG